MVMRRVMLMLMLMRVTFLMFGLVTGLAACTADDGLRQVSANGSSSTTPSGTSSTEVPEEFRPACGKPGSRVVTERLEVRIKHSECDLTGVTIVNQDRAAPVPERGGFATDGVAIEVDGVTGDVTFRAEAEVGH
jgi:hypothetical protein